MKSLEKVSHYRILNKLGAGGMGEVYLAEDNKLRRKVALKLLAANVTRDEDRLRRFEQEAQAASALNHPNILTIYEIGSDDNAHFIATEFIEGETLRRHMQQARMAVSESLDVAIQVASALASAHQAGIVHRDIKPENIMLRSDGYVKVLDFGLAKLIAQTPIVADTEASTVINVDTEPGLVMGTPSYMSPEQARGIKLDTRTDIFSLGVVIYEMIAAHQPFRGQTISDVIVSILDREPPPLTRYAPDASVELQRIISKALRKEREERYQTIKDMLVDLKSLKDELSIQTKLARASSEDLTEPAMPAAHKEHTVINTLSVPATQTEDAPAVHATSSAEYLITKIKGHKTGTVISIIVLLFALLGIAFGLYRLTSKNKSGLSLAAKVTRLTNSGKIKDAAISADGRYVVYIAEDAGESIWVKQVATSSSMQIIPKADVEYFGMSLSPDGNYIFYIRVEKDERKEFNTALYQVPIFGGPPRRLIEKVNSPVTFSPDGKQIAFVRVHDGICSLMLASADGTGEKTLLNDELDTLWCPSWSPNGNLIAYDFQHDNTQTVEGISVETGAKVPISSQRWDGIQQVAWLPDGTGLIVIGEFLNAGEGVNASSLTNVLQVWLITYPNGNIQRITNDLNGYFNASLTSDSHNLVTVQSEQSSRLWLSGGPDFSQFRQVTSGRITGLGYLGLGVTPEGRIVYASAEEGTFDIWSIDADGNNRKQLTFNTNGHFPSVSLDGRHIVFISGKHGKNNVCRINADGTNLKILASGDTFSSGDTIITDAVCSPDAKWVVFSCLRLNHFNLWKVPIDGGDAIQLTDSLGTAFSPSISPDAKSLAYYLFDADRGGGVAVIPMAGGQPVKIYDVTPHPATVQLSTLVLRWTSDGRGLAYADTNKGVSNIWIQPLEGGPAKQLTHFTSDKIFSFDFSVDGQQLVCARGNVTNDVVLISNFK